MQSELVAPSRGTSKNNKKAVPEKAAHIAEQMYFFLILACCDQIKMRTLKSAQME